MKSSERVAERREEEKVEEGGEGLSAGRQA